MRPARFLALLLLLSGCLARGNPGERLHPVEDRGYDARFYAITLELDPPGKRIEGSVALQFTATAPLAELVLDAVELEIEAVRLGGRSLSWSHEAGRLAVVLDPPLAAGSPAEIVVDYHARPRAGLYFVLPEESGVAHPPHVFTQGEPEDARRWFPCHDAPHDRAGHSITATVPASWVTVAAGRSVTRTAAAGSATEVWVMEQEMPTYLFTFCAGPFAVVEEEWDGIAVRYFCEPADVERARVTLADTPAVLRFFSEYTGYRYPFAKYDTVCVRNFPYGGMENVTATTITRTVLHPPERREEASARGLVAHEAAHQWFGDLVTCASWPHAWLNEGFATDFTNLFVRAAEGQDAFLLAVGASQDAYLAACRGRKLRALVKHEYREPFDLFFDGTIYPGGAARLQLLRGWIGEPAFRQAIRLFLEQNAFQSVETAAFQAAAEQAAGGSLEEFFAAWVYAPGYPELGIRWSSDGGRLAVELEQRQSTLGGVPEAFPFPLELRWQADGQEHSERVWVRARKERFEFAAGGSVPFLEVDPQAWLPARITLEEAPALTAARLAGSASARLRQLAARALTGTPAGRAALWTAAESDAVPGVRQAAVLALESLDAEDGETGRALAAHAAEARVAVRNAWLAQLAGSTRDPAVVERLHTVLEDGTASPAARATALQAIVLEERRPSLLALAAPASVQMVLGADERKELRLFIERWAAVRTEGHALEIAALELLAQRFAMRETRDLLLEAAGPGAPLPLRAAALPLLEPWLDEAFAAGPVHAAVLAGLQSPHSELRAAAVQVAVLHPRLFGRELRQLRAVESLVRVRLALEGGGS